jgi:hypothetical protein
MQWRFPPQSATAPSFSSRNNRATVAWQVRDAPGNFPSLAFWLPARRAGKQKIIRGVHMNCGKPAVKKQRADVKAAKPTRKEIDAWAARLLKENIMRDNHAC